MLEHYLQRKNKKETNEQLVSLVNYAQEHKVPIITYEGISFIKQIIKIKGIKRVLELGSAIGYSAINMAMCGCEVTTIERDQNMFDLATKNIKVCNLSDKITPIFDDALDVDETTLGMFDLIFIDAAKSQSIKFVEKYKKCLNSNGLIITDNLLFHGLVVAEIKDRNLKQLVKKIDKFNDYIVANQDFDTFIYSIGDGMSVSILR